MSSLPGDRAARGVVDWLPAGLDPGSLRGMLRTMLAIRQFDQRALELYRDGLVSLDQVVPFGDLYLTWTDHGEQGVRHDPEEYDG